jgi:hypothetical protein
VDSRLCGNDKLGAGYQAGRSSRGSEGCVMADSARPSEIFRSLIRRSISAVRAAERRGTVQGVGRAGVGSAAVRGACGVE